MRPYSGWRPAAARWAGDSRRTCSRFAARSAVYAASSVRASARWWRRPSVHFSWSQATNRSARLGGELADTEGQRDLGVEQIAEDLDGRPFVRTRAARQAQPRGPAQRAADGARRRRQRGQRVATTEAMVQRAAHRAGHLGVLLLVDDIQYCPVTYDVAIIGGGIVGLATARAILDRAPRACAVVLEKEIDIAHHQTGHNSGVIHSGIYYKPGSYKARLCVEGARLMKAYCEKNEIEVETGGNVVGTDS